MSRLTHELLAGLSVWALVIPQALGYASVIGVPPQYGLYTILRIREEALPGGSGP